MSAETSAAGLESTSYISFRQDCEPRTVQRLIVVPFRVFVLLQMKNAFQVSSTILLEQLLGPNLPILSKLLLLSSFSAIESNDILLQPFLPLLLIKARGDTILDHTIEYHSRCNMDALHAVHLHQDLQLICDPISRIETSV